jgi:hypothetical protein
LRQRTYFVDSITFISQLAKDRTEAKELLETGR